MCDASADVRAIGPEVDSRGRLTPVGVAGIVAAQVRTKVWLELDGAFVIGDGSLHLLIGIARHGSLAEAVKG